MIICRWNQWPRRVDRLQLEDDKTLNIGEEGDNNNLKISSWQSKDRQGRKEFYGLISENEISWQNKKEDENKIVILDKKQERRLKTRKTWLEQSRHEINLLILSQGFGHQQKLEDLRL